MTIEFLEGPQSSNQYQNIKYFRKGGMGEIYLANDIINKNQVAIKIIPIDVGADIQLLKQEFDIALKLKDENIIETYYSNKFHIGSEEYFYSSMEYVEDGNFREILKKQQGHFDLNKAVNFMLQIAKGLSYAHKFAIHRDLKPENILNKSGKLLICDFGLSKYIDSKTRSRTLKGSGTLPYMAPETWTYDTNSVAMDLYSLGVLFFEVLTLEQPFKGPTESDFKTQHLFQNLPAISNYRKDLPLRIEEMINKLTSKRAGDRYKEASDVVEILNSLNLSNNSIEGKVPINILLKAQKKISDLNQERLEIEKIEKMESEKKDYLNYSINVLFNKYINRIGQLNEEMEREKIRVDKSNNQLNIRFLSKSASISFYSQNLISQFLEESRASFFDFQNKKYGFIIQEYKKKYLETDGVILIGKAEIQSGSRIKWGYNLILKKESDEDLYGDWYIAWFNDSALYANYQSEQYAIGPPDFFKEYEYGRENIMHVRSMAMNKFDNDSIDKLIEKLFD